MEWAYFQQIVTLLLGRMAVFQVLDDRIEFTIETETFIYFREEFDSTIAHLKMYRYTPTQCYSPREYEVFVEPVEPRYGYRIIDEPIEISDDSSAYRLGSPSDELVLAFLSGIPSDSVRNYRRILSSRIINVRTLRNDAGEIHLLDLIKKVTKISLSLKISLSEGVSAETMLNRATSFLFSVAYNTDTAVKIIHSVNELEFERGHFSSRHSTNLRNLESPKLFYNHELIEQYNLSLTSEDPFIKFIGYYHILEYFFDAVYTDELINSVKDIILHPGFSTKKPKEINKIIDTVRKKTRANQDAFQGTELEALELTIKRFVSLEQLHEDLANYRPDLIAYYKSHEISFSNGDAIDLDNYTSDKLPKKIAARIYKTRNALVHHKSNTARLKERGIYHPFKDEAELSNEIPLMRFVAEAIIIKTATEI